MLERQKISRFDQVRIITTKNVTYLSAPPEFDISPKGVWSVSAIVNDDELLCVRNSIIIKIPAVDVLKIVEYDISSVTKDFGSLFYGGKKE